MREIAIISGKGGTGKTSLTLSLLPYFKDIVIADCDVDAPDMKIIIDAKTIKEEAFYGFNQPVIDTNKCIKCGLCATSCNFNAISDDIVFESEKCEGCNVCHYVCPTNAITMAPHSIGNIFRKTTTYGTLIDASLFPGEESSGKLVSEVRKRSKEAAIAENINTIIIDGSPGVACNVISTITGVSTALIVTEPTITGLHDLKRVIDLVKIFNIDKKVIINKSTINRSIVNEIKKYCNKEKIDVILEIPFEKSIAKAINNKQIPSLQDIAFFHSETWKNFIIQLKKAI
jgi:MinD superfamily P-loop ATPase